MKHSTILDIMIQHGAWGESESGWSKIGLTHDLDPDTSVLVLNDCVHKNGKKLDPKPFATFSTEFLRFLGSTLPSLALQTGNSFEMTMHQGISLVQAKTPLINIDLRKRKSVNVPGANRAQLIQAAKDDYDQLRSDLLQRPSHETGRGPHGLKWQEIGTENQRWAPKSTMRHLLPPCGNRRS